VIAVKRGSLSLGLAVIVSCAGAAHANHGIEADLSTPRRALVEFVTAAKSGDTHRAANVLDLRRLPVKERATRGPELARELKLVLDRALWIAPDEVSDSPNGTPGDGALTEELGEVHVGKKGYPTFDGLVVDAKWAAANEAFMVTLVKVLAKADADYRANADKWTADSSQVKAVAKWSKADAKEVPAAMKLYKLPTMEEQMSATWLGGGAAKAFADTAAFLKEQGRVADVAPDYGKFVTADYVKAAAAK
jgi:hypothetical protein